MDVGEGEGEGEGDGYRASLLALLVGPPGTAASGSPPKSSLAWCTCKWK